MYNQFITMRYLFLLLVTILLGTCNTNEVAKPQGPFPPLPGATTPISYLALGDSYTIGESVAERERYPNQLADSLAPFGIELSPVDIVARTGWTTDELADGIAARDDLQITYDLVTLLIGVNNQYRNRPIGPYEEEFRSLLEQAIEFAAGDLTRVFVISIPDYAFTPFGNGNPTISEGIDAYNAANKAIAETYGVRYFDITPISREGLSMPSLVANDGLHPSGAQYARWVSLMLPTIKEELEN